MSHADFIWCSGWTYSFDGKLVKAPNFQDSPSFDRTSNGLFSISVHVDRLGYIWVNFDSRAKSKPAWDEDFASFDVQPRLRYFNMDDYYFDHQWHIVGDFNWKVFADNYNEVSDSVYS